MDHTAVCGNLLPGFQPIGIIGYFPTRAGSSHDWGSSRGNADTKLANPAIVEPASEQMHFSELWHGKIGGWLRSVGLDTLPQAS